MQLRYGLLAELVAAPGEGDALAAFLASAHIGATVGGNATGFSPAIARGRSIVGGSPGRAA